MNRELIQAAKVGDRNQVEQLLKQGADIHADGIFGPDTVLFWASNKGHEAIVHLLLDPRKYGLDCDGADIHADDDAALRRAAFYGHEAVISLLLDPRKYGIDCGGADIHARHDEALRVAANNGQEALVCLLLDPRKFGIDSDGADIHALNDWALLWAAEFGHEAVVRLLLDPCKYGLEIAGCDRNILALHCPQMLTKIQHLEQQERYQAARVMYYALTFARRNAYTKGQIGSLYQALDMNLS